MGTHRLNESEAIEREGGTGEWRRLMERRRDLDLALPYGPKAVELGLARGPTTPAERARIVYNGPEIELFPPPGTDPDALPF